MRELLCVNDFCGPLSLVVLAAVRITLVHCCRRTCQCFIHVLLVLGEFMLNSLVRVAQVVFHLVLQVLYYLVKLFNACWGDNAHRIKCLGHKIVMVKLICCCRFFFIFLFSFAVAYTIVLFIFLRLFRL